VLQAVLFDWGDTLMRWAPEPGLLEAGHAAGFRALGRTPAAGLTDRFRDGYLTSFFEPGVIEEVEYPSQVRRLLGEFGVEVSDEELARRLDQWTPPPPRYERGYGWMFSRHIQQAHEGCDFDFLETGFGAPVGEPAIF
jgi:hypothetical protein